jgi:hypothetical protein
MRKKIAVLVSVFAVGGMIFSLLGEDDPFQTGEGTNAGKNRFRSEKTKCDGEASAFAERPIFKKLLEKIPPEELERLKKLHEEDPTAFRAELMQKIKSKKDEVEKRNSKTFEMAKKYFATQDETEREKIKAEIKTALQEEFNEKMKQNEDRLQKAEKQLQGFRQKVEERKKNAEKIIEEKLRELTTDPGMKW